MAEVVIVSDSEIESVVDLDRAVGLVEDAFRGLLTGQSRAFPVVREAVPQHAGTFGIKSGHIDHLGALGLKAGGFWLDNASRGLPNHQSAILMFDPATGQPNGLVAANYLTMIRTAALGAIGAKYLARRDSRSICLVGAGVQGRAQLLAVRHVLSGITEIRIYDPFPGKAATLAAEVNGSAGAGGTTATAKAYDRAEEAVRGADVVITATPSTKAIVMSEWVGPGTHLNAMGADTKGKQEMDPALVARAKLVVDNLAQCLELGESQHAYRLGLLDPAKVHAEVAEVITGHKPGREATGELTLFDSTGVAIQDLAVASYAVGAIRASGKARTVTF